MKYNNLILIDNLSEKTIYQKAQSLYNIKILITPLGANIMNLVFSNNPNHLIVLHNGLFMTHYHRDLLNSIDTQNKVNVIQLQGNVIDKTTKNVNTAYTVDIGMLMSIIENINFQ